MNKHYRPPVYADWQGRVDDPADPATFRWHQAVECLDLSGPALELPEGQQGFCLLGFACDEGVRRNKGRIGAKEGPKAIREALASLPWHGGASQHLYDAGDMSCLNGELDAAQEALASAVARIRETGLYPLILGGGHEVAYGTYTGLQRSLGPQSSTRLGIVNIDAHFDIRPFDQQPSSGTMFAQIASQARSENRPFSYLCLGVQKSGNTRALFYKAEQLGSCHIPAEELEPHITPGAEETIRQFAAACEHLYVTLCTDVMAAPFAPGVSAPQPLGLLPGTVRRLLQTLGATGKTIGFDIAEVAPSLDIGNRTSRLAAQLIFSLVNHLMEEDLSS